MIDKVTFNNKEMRYFKFGSGKKIMVMIPGLSIKSVTELEDTVASMYKIFINDYTVYCFDRISNPIEGYSIMDMAFDTIEAIDTLNLKDIYLFGTSQGGMISLVIALERKDLVKKLAIASSTAKIDDSLSRCINDFIVLAKEEKKEELVLEFSELIYPKEYYLKFHDMFIDYARSIEKFELDDFIIFANSILDFNVIDRVNELDLPFMQFHDTNDDLIKIDLAYELKECMNDNYSLVISSGFGHLLYDIDPDFKNKLLEFFNK